jgi:hypothetical protein
MIRMWAAVAAVVTPVASDAQVSSKCAAALSSETVVRMNESVMEIGVTFEKNFDDALRGQCNGLELLPFLMRNQHFRIERTVEAKDDGIVDRFRYVTGRTAVFPMHVTIRWSANDEFMRSNWGVSGL